ncbi:gamma-glutamyl-gamma-aminobutyrate hydrolase family protein [Nocardioides sambongensis]|uniref:gamma-glutamyl-gamma-aminobutyrate hydrolase family protein n=1 Tax=Nocardioides sambongensis TaxID=2589074 RepID=UPI001129E8CE|nr:gamma-glutamyl-gamma-aminobutyrate hydrolase family protein [Nocardioides sambongensis]
MTRPLIGISGRRMPGTFASSMEPRYQARDIDFYFADFSRGVVAAGGLAVQIPYESPAADVVSRLDGLVITGGQDVDPSRWGGDPADVIGAVDPDRDAYEAALIDAALERQLPLLGICRGMQLINVVRGGTLVGHIEPGVVDHRGTDEPVDTLIHEVTFREDSIAASVYGSKTLVNSLHHQCVDQPGESITITGQAPDGRAETLEMEDGLVLGVQWHPEWMPREDPSFAWIVGAAQHAITHTY